MAHAISYMHQTRDIRAGVCVCNHMHQIGKTKFADEKSNGQCEFNV